LTFLQGLLASILYKLIQYLLDMGNQKVKDAIARSKAHSRIGAEVKAAEEAAHAFDRARNPGNAMRMRDATRKLLTAHNAPV